MQPQVRNTSDLNGARLDVDSLTLNIYKCRKRAKDARWLG